MVFYRFYANVNGQPFDYAGTDKAEFERIQNAAAAAIIDSAVLTVVHTTGCDCSACADAAKAAVEKLRKRRPPLRRNG